MDTLMRFFANVRADGGCDDVHLLFENGTIIRVPTGEYHTITGGNPENTGALSNRICAEYSDRVPVHVREQYYIVAFTPSDIQVFVAADSQPAAVALAADALGLDREKKNIIAIFYPDGSADIS